jgi:hypothetical protein
MREEALDYCHHGEYHADSEDEHTDLVVQHISQHNSEHVERSHRVGSTASVYGKPASQLEAQAIQARGQWPAIKNSHKRTAGTRCEGCQ